MSVTAREKPVSRLSTCLRAPSESRAYIAHESIFYAVKRLREESAGEGDAYGVFLHHMKVCVKRRRRCESRVSYMSYVVHRQKRANTTM